MKLTLMIHSEALGDAMLFQADTDIFFSHKIGLKTVDLLICSCLNVDFLPRQNLKCLFIMW